jgi:NAD-dependent histone deacetylase SIR2
MDDKKGFAVDPKKNCPHINNDLIEELTQHLNKEKENLVKTKCKNCDNTGENWLCLVCKEVFCSRYVNSHMAKHNEQDQTHNLAISF